MNSIINKIKKIESLIARASTAGEKNAAISAKKRLIEKYPELAQNKKIKEFKIYTTDFWHKKLLLAICRKYEINPYRYKRQKYTTVMIRTNRKFLDEILWKEYVEFSDLLESLIEDITDEVISKIHEDEGDVVISGDLE